jgi:uncharacterized membrane protein YeaQ/YmgE (transglycosylase-associated protein family)
VGLFAWIVFGLVAGAIARLIVPGRQAIGCLPTLAVGIVGALLGGFLGQLLLGHDVKIRWALGPFLLAIGGSVLLLLALDAVARRRRRRWPW